MKFIRLIFIILLFKVALYAYPPDGYYDSAEGLSGEALKSALHEIIDDHIEFPYTSSGTDVWDILKESDQDPNNPDNVILFYTGWSVNGDMEYDNGSGWNREHVWAKSHGDFGTSMGPGTDAHQLRPSDISVNSARGNKDFDEGGSEYIDGDGATGCYSDSDSWEPRDEVKGDAARIIFYMATRYEGDSGELDLEVNDNVNNSPLPFHGRLSALYQWNLDDPPSDFEMHRNDVIYEDFQGNRNPFIDHPEYVTYIWGNEIPEDTDPPEIDSVYAFSATSVIVDFSEWVDPTTAGEEGNYSIDNGIGNPLDAASGYSGDNSKVQLTVPELETGMVYTISISNVEDLNENDILPGSLFQFEIELNSTVILISAGFEEGMNDWMVYNAASNAEWERSSSTSYGHPYSVPEGSFYHYINNYSSDEAAEDWLISPQLDLTGLSAPVLSFYSWNQYDDNIVGLEVKYSLEYNGSSIPGSFSWVTVDADLATDGSTTWLQEEGEGLPGIAGEDNVYLAFKYTSTGTGPGTCRAWAVDDIVLTAETESDLQLPTPQNVQINHSVNSITLTWDSVSGATHYNIYSDTDPYGTFDILEASPADTTWSETLPAGANKFYKVAAE